ncbi:MAG: T9SS type A sorting domain-containing protein, partial [Bacteroidales bacterium]|nr:T9SS type A sorting domain-containing protein [Bacteroidales bacterium]
HLGNIVQTKEIYIPEGEQIIELDFDIPIGENFRLTCEGPANLYRGFSGYILPFGFPYKIDSYLEIKQSDDLLWWDDEKKYYPYFYDWEVILQSCASHRVPVYAIITNEAPIASFSYDNNLGTYNFYGLSENASNWEWDFGDGNFSDQQNPTHTYQANSTYTVKLTVSNQCGSSDYSEEINVDLSVEINDISKFSIYPNPSYDKINIENLKQGDLIEIYSNSGQKLYSKKLESSFITLDLMNLPKSSYVLRIISDSKVYNFKLVKI